MRSAVQVHRGDGVNEDRKKFRLVHDEKLPWDAANGTKSVCRTFFYSDGETVVVIAKDLDIGQSVTNGAETIATKVMNQLRSGIDRFKESVGMPEDIIPTKVRFFEVYVDKKKIAGKDLYEATSWDEVFFEWTWTGYFWEAESPGWKPVSQEFLEGVIGHRLKLKNGSFLLGQ